MKGQSRAERGRSRREGEKQGPEWSALEEYARGRIQGWIQDLLEEEITELLGRKKSERRSAVDGDQGYRNGYGKVRRLSMMAGTITLRRPRVRGVEERFESRILPLFVRRTEQVGELLPQLYLHGLAQGDFELALRGLLGEGAPLSPSSIERLRAKWQLEFEQWSQRRLEDLEVVYAWADGVYVKAGLEENKAALLVIIGALRDGRKVVLAVESGQRESKESWARVLRGLRDRGLKPWRATVADGHLGIWAALAEVFPQAEELRCWNHRIVNVIDQLPKKLWAEARELLRQVAYAETRSECERGRDRFVARYGKAYPKAAATLCRDWERLVAFYDFPKEHWRHLRTSNPVESPFAALRLRTSAAKRYKKVASAEALIWKTLMIAEKKFRRLNAPELLETVASGKKFVDGVAVNEGKRKTKVVNRELAA
ncbi:MAG: IS256 family transposase [Acidobacteriota bacterium]